jgi:glycerol-3-phosphate acyltransferase PlsY
MSSQAVIVVLAGYLLGSVPFGLLLTRAAGLEDIRKIGSGSIGATNVLRTGRKSLAAATVLLDGLKGVAAVLLGAYLAGVPGVLLGGLAAVVGHCFPVWLRFRGGKGVATGFGVLIAADPVVGLAAGAVWIASALLVRISSASGLISFLFAPLLAWALARPQPVPGLALAVMAVIFLRHRSNIERLLKGTEPRIGARK